MIHPTTPATSHPVAVILPIYRDTAMTLRCIDSAIDDIVRHPDRRLILINDGSPEPDMAEALAAVAARWPGQVLLHTNAGNLGFVLTVNTGFELAGSADVVLLNSDVIVADDWLTRLQRAAYDDDAIGTVTPLSNNAEICSFPTFLQDNPLFLGRSVKDLQRAFGRCRLPPVEAPTGVGFCMYIKAACLRDTGPLDHTEFGRGYGEENDFCQRALKLGWKSVVSSNLFAYHEGGVSFSSEKEALIANAMRTIDRLHPHYHADVQRFIAADALRPQRIIKALDVLAGLEQPKIVLIEHGLGGGIGQHIDELVASLRGVVHCLLLRPAGDGGSRVVLEIAPGCDRVTLDLATDTPLLCELLHRAGAGLLHYHHTVGFSDHVLALPAASGLPHMVTVHDFYWLTGNPTLSDQEGVYRPGRMDAINPLYPPPAGYDPQAWRERMRALLETARPAVFPSTATLALYRDGFALENAQVVPHLEPGRAPCAYQPKPLGSPVKIVAIGAISKAKGADLLEALAGAGRGGSPARRFALVGYAYRALAGVLSTGPYAAAELPALIEEQGPDAFLFTSQWPETYCYTLSYALTTGRAIIAPDIGAFRERLAGRPGTLLFNYLDEPAAISARIDTFLQGLASQDSPPEAGPATDGRAGHFYHGTYPELARPVATAVAEDALALHAQLLDTSHATADAPLLEQRERLLRTLWQLYSHPWLRPLGNLLPFSWRRGIKRRLSRRPLQDVITRDA